MQNEQDIGPFRNNPAGLKTERRKCAFRRLLLNNRRKRGEEWGLSLWDAISVLWKLTQDTFGFRWETHVDMEGKRPWGTYRWL